MNSLTRREVEILLCATRYGIRGASQELGLAPQTVKNTLQVVYTKLGARSMAHAILILSER
jgi:DNA-binding NarL/FixJ family response regulator